jgi:type II secretory pathway component PulM
MKSEIKNGSVDYQAYYIQNRKRAKFVSLALTSATLVSLVFLVFAFSQKRKADNLEQELKMMQQQATHIKIVAEENMKMAQEQRAIADESKEMALKTAAELEQCKQSRKK